MRSADQCSNVAPTHQAPRRPHVIGRRRGLDHIARAQKPSMPVIGYLCPNRPICSAAACGPSTRAARSRLVEGRNVAIEYQWAHGQYARLPELAAELVARHVDVVVAPGGAPVALAAKATGTTSTIIFEMGGDPVQLGVVDSLPRPGGNITGVSSLSVDVSPKRLELMHELLPTADQPLAVVANPTSPTANSQLQKLRSGRRSRRHAGSGPNPERMRELRNGEQEVVPSPRF